LTSASNTKQQSKDIDELLQGKEEYIFEGVIDAITGQPKNGKAINPATKETYEGTCVWRNNEPVDGIVITKRYTYIGKLRKGRFMGRGWLAKSNLFIYDSEFLNGLFHGIGKQSHHTNLEQEEFSGEFHQGMRQGIGTLRKKNYVYSGMWNCGVREGEGSEIIHEEEYVGQFLRDKRHGFGMMTRHGVVCEEQ